jgi:hypothetical protein
MVRHAFIIAFTILLLFFLYQEGESLAEGCRRVLRHCIGDRAEGYVDLATRAVRASMNSMLVVGLFDVTSCSPSIRPIVRSFKSALAAIRVRGRERGREPFARGLPTPLLLSLEQLRGHSRKPKTDRPK